jgi:hypothetical protein
MLQLYPLSNFNLKLLRLLAFVSLDFVMSKLQATQLQLLAFSPGYHQYCSLSQDLAASMEQLP